MKNKKNLAAAIAILQCAMIEAYFDNEIWQTLNNAATYLSRQAHFSTSTEALIYEAAATAWGVGRIQERNELCK